MTNGHLGLLMLAMICVGIMLGFPTAFTLMGMGVFFAWLAYRSVDPSTAVARVLDLFVQRTYGVMSNDVLIAIPLFLFMGYLVERAQLIDRLFRSLHLATARIPGALAVATIVTCAIFATATGIVGAVVTLMGLLAFPAMLKAGYNIKVAAGAVTAGGCLGILIPPSVLLIVYGAVAGVSVVQLYAGAFLPGIMLASLYIGYVILLAAWKPSLMPPLAESERRVERSSVGEGASAVRRKRVGGTVARRRRASWRRGYEAHRARATVRLAASGALYRGHPCCHLPIGDRAGSRGEHRRPDPSGRPRCCTSARAGFVDRPHRRRGTRRAGYGCQGAPGGRREGNASCRRCADSQAARSR